MTLIIGKILYDQEGTGRLFSSLKNSEEKFRTLVEHAFDGIYMMTEKNYTYVNERFCELTGYSSEELTSADFDFNLLLTEKSKEIVSQRYLTRKRGETLPVTYEMEILTKNGMVKEVELSTASIGSKENLQIIGIMRDITDRKKSEEELKAAKERMQILVEGTPHLFFYVQDTKANVNYISPSIEKITGHSVEEWLGQRHWFTTDSPINDEARRRTYASLSGVINTDPILAEIYHADGNTLLLEIYEKPIFEGNKVVGLQGVAHDVTKQKIAEEQLRKLNTRLQTAIEGANIGIWDQDFTTNKVVRLGRWGEMLGYSTSEIDSEFTSWKELIHPDDMEAVKQSIIAHETGNVNEFKVEHRLRTKDGDYKWILNWGKVYQRDEKGKPLKASGIHLDIDERKRAELEIKNAKEQAENANQLKSEFLAQISHEIRSPLNAVLNFSQLIKEEFKGKLKEELEVSFSGIESASKRVIRTIDLILNMSELQLGTYEVTKRKLDLTTILSNIRKEYLNLAKSKNLELRFISNYEKAEIYSDEYAVNQIFANLVDNAIKYTNKGYVEISLSKNENDSYSVKITDSGIGISQEYLPEIFEAFSQEERGYSRRFEGSGLGMSLVKKYCELINAEIHIESKRGKGATFTVVL
ncbi:sensory box histidine kinase/response regulator [hydrocarbon metagenome]|uniref:histidine kinase n=1 Tax=hydrocarbon metagenome TaxID=938273 RepID=A0A0W8FY67_9ZZZZ